MVSLRTKLANKQKPIVQQQGNSEGNFRRNELYTLLVVVFTLSNLLILVLLFPVRLVIVSYLLLSHLHLY